MKRAVQIVVLTVLLAACSWAVTVGLLPPPMASFTDANGLPLAGGLICTYAAGTSTPLATYTDSTGTVANANPVILNASGRANIWLATNTPYKITVRTSGGNCAGTGPGGVLVTSTDNVSGVPPAAPILWSSSGTTMSNLYGYKVCISATSCTSSLALLNIQGTSVGGVGLLRIDDAGGTPGVDLYGASGVALGSYGADSSGLRLRTPGGISQMVVGSNGITIQNMSVAGATSVTVQGGVAQGSTNLLRFKDSAGTEVSYITPTGTYRGLRYNATATAYAYTFSNSNDLFLVDGYGDVTATGQLNVKGVNSPLLTDNAAIKVNGVKVIDNTGNATFTSLTCTGTPCGSGGGGGGSFPVSDATTLFYNAATATKRLKYDLSGITAATLRVASWPDADITVAATDLAQTFTGAQTFSDLVTANSGVTGTVFNSTSTGASTAFQLDNTNFMLDGKGNITTVCASGCTAGVDGANAIFGGYVTAGTWFGLKRETGTPATHPGTGYSALTYKGGTSGLEVWVYDVVHAAWSTVDLASVGGTGITSINGQTGAAQTISGTTKQITATTTSDTVTLSTPQNIDTAADVTFKTLSTTGTIQSSSSGTAIAFQTATPHKFQVNGDGVIYGQQLNIASTQVVDSSRNGYFNNVTIGGSCLGSGCTGGGGSGVSSISGTANQVIASAPTGAVTLSLPQAIATTSTPTFANVVATGLFNSTASGSAIAFQTSTSTFQVNGAGSVSSSGTLNMAPVSGNAINVFGAPVVDRFGSFVGASVNVSSGALTAGSLSWYGGYTVIDTARNASLTSLSLTAGILAQGNLIALGGVAAGTTVSAGVNFAAAGQAGQTYTITIPGMSISGSGCTGGLYVTGGIIRGCF